MQVDLIALYEQYRLLTTDLFFLIFSLLILLDLITGLAKAISLKVVTSTKGLNGVVKHLSIFSLVLALVPMMYYLEMSTFGIAFIIFFILQYAVSILENLEQLGIPMPNWVKTRLIKMHERYNEIEIFEENAKVLKIIDINTKEDVNHDIKRSGKGSTQV